MLAIKLKPVGKKHQRSFRIIVSEKRTKLQGKFVEDLGWFNPHTDKFFLKKERINFWLKNGAKPTESVFNLLVTAKIINGPKIPVHKKSKKEEIDEKKENTENAS